MREALMERVSWERLIRVRGEMWQGGKALLCTELQPIDSMLVVHVQVHLRPECVEAFKAATLENARQSILEPGIARFDVVQQTDDPTRFVLVEIYRTPDDPPRHKETAHYLAWRDTVEPMMAEPRRSVKYRALFPTPARWELV